MSSLKFRLKNIDETINYLLEDINHNGLMSEKYNKLCKYLNYVEHLFILGSAVSRCISVSAFAPLVCVPVGIMSSAVGIKICAINAGMKKVSVNYKGIEEKVW